MRGRPAPWRRSTPEVFAPELGEVADRFVAQRAEQLREPTPIGAHLLRLDEAELLAAQRPDADVLIWIGGMWLGIRAAEVSDAR
jgi:hypothetical protein